MALSQTIKNILDQGFTADPGSGTFNDTATQLAQFLKSGQATEDDLKPYIDKLNGLGFGIDLNSGALSKSAGNGSPIINTPVINKPPDSMIPTSPSPSEVPGQTIPGPTIDLNSDRGQIEQEAAREKQQQTDALTQALGARTQGLNSLSDILQKQNQAQFNYDLPGIKEDLSNSGLFTSPSALAAAVTRESGMLGANTAAQLGQYGLQNADLQSQGILNINQAQNQFQQSGLQRQFSVADYNKQAQLAQQIGATSVPQSPGFSLSGAIGGGGAAGIAGAGLAASNPALYAGLIGAGAIGGGAKSGGGTFICTAMKEAGILTQEEVDQIHDHIFPAFPKNVSLVIAYGIYGPQLVAKAFQKGIDWNKWKDFFFGRVLAEKDQDKAFDIYAEGFFKLWKEVA